MGWKNTLLYKILYIRKNIFEFVAISMPDMFNEHCSSYLKAQLETLVCILFIQELNIGNCGPVVWSDSDYLILSNIKVPNSGLLRKTLLKICNKNVFGGFSGR